MAVASAGPHASLHLAPDRQPRQHTTTQFFYRPDALPAAHHTHIHTYIQIYIAPEIARTDLRRWHTQDD